MQRTTSTQRNLFGQQARKMKKWDQTTFAKSGVKQAKPKDKGKQRAGDDESDGEHVEFEQFPAPFVSCMSSTIFGKSSIDASFQSGMFLVLDRSTFTHNYRYVMLNWLDIFSFLRQCISAKIIHEAGSGSAGSQTLDISY